MTGTEYHHLRAIYRERIQQHLPNQRVDTLIEAPEKSDHGDIDFVVSYDEHQPLDFIALANAVGAYGVICADTQHTCYLACLRDGTRSSSPTIVFKPANKKIYSEATDGASSAILCSQIDVHFVPAQRFDWHMFMYSYGGMTGVLGRMVRQAGFRLSDIGLSLRLQALDDAKAVPFDVRLAESAGMLFLSNDPYKVMEFLGLSQEMYGKGFKNRDELYRWLGSCKLMSKRLLDDDQNNSRHRRQSARPIFFDFFESWLPTHIATQQQEQSEWYAVFDANSRLTRQELRELNEKRASDAFHKHVELQALNDALVLQVRNQIAEHLLKPVVSRASGFADGKRRTEVIRAMRRWVSVQGEQISILSAPQSDDNSQLHRLVTSDGVSLLNPDLVERWMFEHWSEVRRRERKGADPDTTADVLDIP